MPEQLSLLDIANKEDIDKLTPEMWDCMKSCANFTNKFPGGGRDYFFDGSPRCTYAFHCGYGTSGKDMRNKVIDNMWHTWCKLYKPKERNK